MRLKWLIISQSNMFFASSLIFPFYILFIKNIGSSFTQFGLSYGIFGLSAALVHPILGRLNINSRYFLMVNAWGMAVVLLYFPHIENVYQVYVVQVVMGIFGACQKHGEKSILAEMTNEQDRGRKIGNYHFWTSIFASFAIMIGGVLADYFTIYLIFYLSSVIFFVSGLLLLKGKVV